MTDFLESVRPVQPLSLTESVRPDEAVEPSVRQLLAELAHLEDVVRTAVSPVDDPEVLARPGARAGHHRRAAPPEPLTGAGGRASSAPATRAPRVPSASSPRVSV